MDENLDKEKEVKVKKLVQETDLISILDEIEAKYWVPFLKTPFKQLDQLCEKAKSDCPALQGTVAAFTSNLNAAKELLEYPYLLIAPQFCELSDFTTPSDDIESLVAFATKVLKGSKGPLIRHNQTMRLMHQACLLIWGALEIYCKEVFIYSLNERPELYLNLQKNESLKSRFSISQSSWMTILESHGFNLNGKLGTIVAADKDFSSPQLLQSLFTPLYAGFNASPELLAYFQSKELWKLGQRRHLIAHKCALVDNEYISKTGDSSQEIGNVLHLKGRDVAEGMAIAAQCAIGLYGWARFCWTDQEET